MKLSFRYLFLASLLLIGSQTGYSQLTSTNLPILLVNTPSAITTTQAQGTLTIIDNASGVNTPTSTPKFTGMIGVNIRGNTTYPKSSYSVETWSAPTVSLDTSLLGMPSENDWVLMSAYEDRSLMRSTLAYHLHDAMGRYASRQRYCELIVNSQYMGIYTFGEKIKRDSLRLDIANLGPTDNSGINLTGGYIVKIDGGAAGWNSAYAPPYGTTQTIHFEYEYPSAGDIIPVQEAYIKSYVDSFENEMNAANFQDTLLGWRRHGAENSFIDYMIMQEITRNNEAYRKNNFFYKDKGTKLRPGPLWAMELSWRNTADCNGAADTGWAYHLGGVCGTNNKLAPFWWQKLTTDTKFMEELKCRYTNFRRAGQILDTVKIFHFIDSVNTYLNAQNAVARNFTQWPIWGVPIVNEPTPMATDYTGELKNLKAYIKARLAWLDTKWTSTSPSCYPLGVLPASLEQDIAIFPNPASDQVFIEVRDAGPSNYQFQLFTIQGEMVRSFATANKKSTIDLSSLSSGMYLLSITSERGNLVRKIVKE